MRLKAKRDSFEPNSQLLNQSIYLSCKLFYPNGYILQTNFPGFHGAN